VADGVPLFEHHRRNPPAAELGRGGQSGRARADNHCSSIVHTTTDAEGPVLIPSSLDARGGSDIRPGPRRRVHDWEEARHATWLELFFDLVVVVAVASLASLLHDDHSFGA
jgi:hypothetical protein